MAYIAAMPPTPQQSFHAPAVAPTQASPQPQMHPMQGYGHAYSASFDSQQGAQHPPAPQAQMYGGSQSFASNGPIANPGYARSFGDGYGHVRGYEKPQIYTVSAC